LQVNTATNFLKKGYGIVLDCQKIIFLGDVDVQKRHAKKKLLFVLLNGESIFAPTKVSEI
jgi:hypothetical protein